MDLYGRIRTGQRRFLALRDGPGHPAPNPSKLVESTSQAEYAGSIPVIGSNDRTARARDFHPPLSAMDRSRAVPESGRTSKRNPAVAGWCMTICCE